MSNLNVVFCNSIAVLGVCESLSFPTCVERQDEGGGAALSVRPEEVSEGRIWRRNESVQ